MPDAARIRALRTSVAAELTEGLLPYWMTHTLDDRYGGFVGRILHDGRVDAEAPRAAVLNTRILWTFAAAGRILRKEGYRQVAQRAFAYLWEHFRDAEYGGIYWMLDHAGRPLQTKKQVYAQAFAVYGLSEYYRLTGESRSLNWAIDLFQAIETHSFDADRGGYFEAYSRAWTLLDDVRLSDKDANEKKTMNTHLHVLEAYTTLYRVWPDPVLKRQMQHLIDRFLTTIIDPRSHHLRLFFDERWTSKSAVVSYGHDIEASWLLSEAAEVLGEPGMRDAVHRVALQMAKTTLDEAFCDDGGLHNERADDGHLDDDRYWWPQVEAVVGFLNAYQLSGEDAFLDAALVSWAYVDKHFIDREHGEWYARVSRDGVPYASEDKVGPWKGPYHNVRVCLEVLGRIEAMTGEG